MTKLSPSPEAVNAVTERLHSACLTIGSMLGMGPQDPPAWPLARSLWWQDPDAADLPSNDVMRRFLALPRFQATPHQVADCLPTLGLLADAQPLTRRVLSFRARQAWHALPGGWRSIGHALEMSHTLARETHWAAVIMALHRSALPVVDRSA